MTTPEHEDEGGPDTERMDAIQLEVDGGAGWTVQNQDVHPASGNPALSQAVADETHVDPEPAPKRRFRRKTKTKD
jgi:hypothetical protein